MMPTSPTLPANAPFTAEQQAWLNGYLAGLFSGSTAVQSMPSGANAADSKGRLWILFGSQTGTAEGLARKTAKAAAAKGWDPLVLALNDTPDDALKQAGVALVITSTWGEGDPPDNAAAFWTRLNAPDAPRLECLNYAVLGLGDRNYSDFCGAATKFDTRLAELGGKRLVAAAACDTDYQAAAAGWLEAFWPLADNVSHSSVSISASPARESLEPLGARDCSPRHDKTHPFPGRLRMNRKLNRPGSDKDTRHLEIAIDPSRLSYEAGDALGVRPTNCPVLVEELMATLGYHGDESVAFDDGSSLALQSALVSRFSISQPSSETIRLIASTARNAVLTELLAVDSKTALNEWLWGRDLVDVLKFCGAPKIPLTDLIATLPLLRPRLYSISSSPKAHADAIHLTVAVVRYEAHGRVKRGVCSTFLADRVPQDGEVPVFVQTSHGFRPPTTPETPMIMIGPGTGIAPFRAFLQDRHASGAPGRHWLFFGDQRRSMDFLYEEELTAWRDQGFLTRLDLAFSRDQAEKIYVQDRMRENAAEFWRWLEEGAHLYVCGDAKRMAKDVDKALHDLIATQGGLSAEAASAYVQSLKKAKRYQRDVY